MHFSSTQPREELKTHGCLDAPSTPAPPLAPLHRPTSPDAALPQYFDRRLGGEDEHGTAAVANPPSASTPGQFEGDYLVVQGEEWEIIMAARKRRAGKGYQIQVRWKSRWMARSELGNAQRLVREFDAIQRAWW